MIGLALSALAFAKRIPAWAYVALGAAVFLWGYGNHREAQGVAKERARMEKAAHAQFVADAQALADLSLRYEQTAQALRDAERTDRERIREVFRNVQVPANCAAPADVVSVLDNAVSRANAATTGQSGGTVPKAP